MKAFNGIQFDGRFYAEVVQGTYKLFTEVKFTAILNIEIAVWDCSVADATRLIETIVNG